ncbi:hypothetical protein AFA91_09700 [Mycolicibacterium goodii]|uniref:FAS1-like dehydratase domain-containing protein n=2 Tax=Mycolicibacterium goodii TaxID=134601 RepID=A0A0K0X3S7_MYCGD|nr:hypothetical protein AFA91_09700 [Mycolicibacterium goodii]
MTTSTGEFHLEAGQIAAMERSFGGEAFYRDGAVAPLTFSQASAHEDPQSPLRPHPGRPWGAAAVSGDSGEGWLHAEQHFEYRSHPTAGECLRWRRRPGDSWTKNGSTGALHFREEITEFVDRADQVVITSRIVRVRQVPSVNRNGS